MRKAVSLMFCFLFSVLLCISCEDYIETGIEGQWQLRKVVDAEGVEHSVDTIFYAFKKDVFRYLSLKPGVVDTTFTCFGNYKEEGDSLFISVVQSSFQPWDCLDCLDWSELNKHFFVKKHKGNSLELVSEGVQYIFRKY